ncbi:hypothetical protein [Ohtaekwangia koreensis]|uniref:Uncharacterized protein n=1 Tax=Ohtaekwangia koreensis TaxID=688867 RepID=A0A1T5JQK3_9BACT|nr:hypothetical protein [Ohtaekwangia koreensis]SKC53605.1 hypothetical protein SAMN05660236_1364 [Ohtaekwangia koreensis]
MIEIRLEFQRVLIDNNNTMFMVGTNPNGTPDEIFFLDMTSPLVRIFISSGRSIQDVVGIFLNNRSISRMVFVDMQEQDSITFWQSVQDQIIDRVFVTGHDDILSVNIS